MATRPKRTAEQQLGQLAEQHFGTFVVEHGDLWHATTLGNDLGLDGRVELIDAAEVTGVEFGVQVKGAERLTPSRNGSVPAGRARASTVRYWLSRLSPTLVVAYSKRGNLLFAEWAHRIPAVAGLDPRPGSSPTRVTLRIPAQLLTADRWQEFRAGARSMHGVVLRAFNDEAVRQVFGMIHRELSDIADVLVEWVYSLAYNGTVVTGLPSGVEVGVERLNTPRFVREGGHMFPMWLASAAVNYAASFRASLETHLPTEHPLFRLVHELALSLQRLRDAMYVDGKPPGAAAGELAWARVDVPRVMTNLGIIPLLIRDFNRELRPFLFPMTDALRSFAANADEARTIRVLHSLVDNLFTPTSEWIDGHRLIR